MSEGKRRYESPARRAQANRTRDTVVAAATAAFTESGWSATTIPRIAARAGVSPQTVHLAIGGKADLLLAAVRAEIAAGPGGLLEQEPFVAAFADGTVPALRAAAFAAGARQVYERAGALFLVLAVAATTDAAVAAMWHEAKAVRLRDCRRLLRRAEVTARDLDRRAELLFVLSGPGMHADLVRDRGWPADEYERWLADEVLRLLQP